MALSVGELAGTITLDASGATTGAAQAESAMRSAESTANTAGDTIERELGEGGQQGGEAAAAGVERGMGKMKLAALAGGAAAGLALTAGLAESMSQDKSSDLLAAQLGATGKNAKQYGDVAGKLFTSAVVDDFAEGTEVIKGIMQKGILPPDASNAQLESISTKIYDTSKIMGEDLGKTTSAVSTILKNGLAPNAEAALDVLVKGTQNGVNKQEDLLDTFTEYPTVFKGLGLDAQTAMGLLQQGLQGGARDSDFLADALKEFGIRAIDGSKSSAEAFKSLGLDAEKMTAQIAKGGPEASAGLQTVLDRLKAMKDPVERNTAAVGLFGTKAEDLGASLYALDPKSAVAALGDVSGAAAKAGDTMRDNASTQIEQFKRAVSQAFVDFLGAKALPVIKEVAVFLRDHFGPTVSAIAGWVRGDLVPAMRDSAKWIGDNRVPILAVGTAITLFLLPAMIAAAIGATTSAATQVVAWVLTRTTATTSAATSVAAHWATIGGWIAAAAQAVISAAVVVGGWALMGAQAMIRGAQMAAAWILAMGPVAWVIAAIVLVAGLVIYYWDEIAGATKAVWGWIVGIVSGAWEAIKNAFSAAGRWVSDKASGIGRAVTGAMSDMKNGAVSKANELVSWLRGFPGSLVSSLGDLGRLLLSAGGDTVRGLWSGIEGMGPWLVSKLSGWVKDKIPGPIRKALGINSPSRVMRDQVGRWIPQGIVDGIDAGAPAVTRSMQRLVAIPNRSTLDALTTSAAAPNRGAFATGSSSSNGVHIENWYAGDASADEMALALAWRAKAGG
ncbi:phage tail tape measure protein [Embleya sp. MST-111070]|uniref:phage tail tape measure protein n=1 Tax=Embleya sp. MST-111070 TaxID=3398231 RepID=UPI003F739134